MDKELLTLLIRHLSEQEVIALYKIKNINNFGFRANSPEDIKKNRGILESNLLKAVNYKIVQKNLMNSYENIDIDNISIENFQDFINEHGLLKLSSTLYIQNKIDLLTNFLDNLNIPPIENSDSKITNSNITNESDTKSPKIIKKLEAKIMNLSEELEKRDKQFKTQLEEKIIELNNLRLEKNKLNIELSTSIKKNQDLTNTNNEFITQNDKLKHNFDTLNELLNKKLMQIESLQIELKQTTEITNTNENTNHLNHIISIEDNSKQLSSSNIAVIGEYSRIISEQLPTYKFTFFEIKRIEELKNDLSNYDCLWIINYDLTQKEQKIITNILINDFKKIETHNILTLKDLNIILATFKQKDGI